MNDCLVAWFGSDQSQSRADKVQSKLASEIDLRRNDVRHAQISVGVTKAAVADAYRAQGRKSQAFSLGVAKLRREQMREQTCSSVLRRLEDAQHMTAMREITVSALTALKGINFQSNEFQSLYSTVDDHAAIAEEAKEQVEEIAECFSVSNGDSDIDELLIELGLETKTSVPSLSPTAGPPTDDGSDSANIASNVTSVQKLEVASTALEDRVAIEAVPTHNPI